MKPALHGPLRYDPLGLARAAYLACSTINNMSVETRRLLCLKESATIGLR